MNIYITCVDTESDTDNIQKVGVGLRGIPVLSHLDMSTKIWSNDKKRYHEYNGWFLNWFNHSNVWYYQLFFWRISRTLVVLESTSSYKLSGKSDNSLVCFAKICTVSKAISLFFLRINCNFLILESKVNWNHWNY